MDRRKFLKGTLGVVGVAAAGKLAAEPEDRPMRKYLNDLVESRNFGLAPIKRAGSRVEYDKGLWPTAEKFFGDEYVREMNSTLFSKK